MFCIQQNSFCKTFALKVFLEKKGKLCDTEVEKKKFNFWIFCFFRLQNNLLLRLYLVVHVVYLQPKKRPRKRPRKSGLKSSLNSSLPRILTAHLRVPAALRACRGREVDQQNEKVIVPAPRIRYAKVRAPCSFKSERGAISQKKRDSGRLHTAQREASGLG